MPKGRQPIIKPAFINVYGSDWENCVRRDYSSLNIDEALEKFQNDTHIVVSKGGLLFFCNQIPDFSFASSGKKRVSHFSKLQPALEKGYGTDWENGFKKTCEGLTLEEATERINKDLDISVSSATVLNHANKLNVEFKESPKIIDPNKKKKGKPNLTLQALLVHYKTEDALRTAFEELSGYKAKDIAESINRAAGTEITVSNMYNLVKGFGIDFSCKRTRKSANIQSSDVPLDLDFPEGIEIPKSHGKEIPVKFTCQTKNCKGERGQKVDLEYGLGLRARRCGECNEFGTFKAQYRKPDGSIASVILKEIDGITCEVDETEILQEVMVE